MIEKKFTEELGKLINYIDKTLLKKYNTDNITTEYFILAVLENDYSVGNKILSKIMLLDTIAKAKEYYYGLISNNINKINGAKHFDGLFKKSIMDANELSKQQCSKKINSGQMLSRIITNNQNIGKYFKSLGVTLSQVNMQSAIETANLIEEENAKTKEKINKNLPVNHVRRSRKQQKQNNVNDIVEESVPIVSQNYNNSQIGECEKLFVNLNEMTKHSQIETVYGNEQIYDEIFVTLSKRNKNNVIIVGKSGVGKTATAKNLANLIVNGNVPKVFKDKVLLEINFNTLFSGTGMRGAFETRMRAILNDACAKGNYIFFIDSLSSVLSSKFNENEVENFIEAIMEEKKIMLICTCSEKGYTKEIANYPEWERYFEKINLNEPSEEKCIEILKHHAQKLEYFHGVKYEDASFKICVEYSKRYITERNLPDSAIDILDKTGAKVSLSETENDNVRIAREKLDNLRKEKDVLRLHTNSKRDYIKLDKLEKQEIELQTVLDFAVKKYNLEKQPFMVTEDMIKECISEKTSIPLKKLTANDKKRLNGLNERIKACVIGQNEAIDEVCKAIKRQRIGIGNPNKPIVFFFGGSTGVGKTYLAKTIAKELWGDENNLIRLDMSEYSETNSVTKLYGAPPSYVGYGDNSSLADKLKEKKYCILLLDEIEKACDKVFNVFLQLFDEGRITDNKGNTVDCKNVIVIMTSNIAAKEISFNKSIGFIKGNDSDNNKEIIKKELRKAFNPEFLNRIDDFIYFNKLSKEDVKYIISLNIKETEKRINNIGYGFDGNINDDDFINYIKKQLDGKEEYGARPIKSIIQRVIEDKICDMIVENKVNNGYCFKKEDFIH